MAQRGTRARIDLQELERLCMLSCTDQELAGWFHVSVETIERRRKVKAFSDAMERGRAKGHISLRRLQLKAAEEGNSSLLIWLGRQLLGQTDQVNVNTGPSAFILLPCVHTTELPVGEDSGP